MAAFNTGDLVTFPLRDGRFGVAHLVHIDDLALNDLYHFAICDAVVDGVTSEATDDFGRPMDRDHERTSVEAAPLLIEHMGLTRHGLDASDLCVVSSREVEEEDLSGYRTWLQLRYEDAIRRGVIRDRIDDNPDDDFRDTDEIDPVNATEHEEGDELVLEVRSDARERVRETTEDADHATETGDEPLDESDKSDESQNDLGAPDVTTLGIHDVAIGDALVRQRSVFEREAYRDSTLGQFILGLADDTAKVEDAVARLLDGDFSAGDELMEYGETGMRVLGDALRPDVDPQTADDVLQVLVNSGEPVAYERVAAFMVAHGSTTEDPLYVSAVRSYCYAVMLTAGEPETLQKHLAMLDEVTDPELADDVRAARDAIKPVE